MGRLFFCMGGTGALVDALEGLLRRQGVEIATGKDIRRIEVSSNKVTGVILDDGERIQGECVVCNADPPTVYKEMLDRGTAFERRSETTSSETDKILDGSVCSIFRDDPGIPRCCSPYNLVGKAF